MRERRETTRDDNYTLDRQRKQSARMIRGGGAARRIALDSR